jgi:hypothetical protein
MIDSRIYEGKSFTRNGMKKYKIENWEKLRDEKKRKLQNVTATSLFISV